MKPQTRHEQLLEAGWHYDSATDRYRAPASADDGTAKQYNEAAAYQQLLSDRLNAANAATQPPTRAADPRRKEPE